MSRSDLGGEGEEAFEPGTGGKVLRNKLGITDPREMDQLEAEALTTAAVRSYEELDTATQFTVDFVREMHRSWLGDIYFFAGQIRTVNVSKGNILFAPAAFLESTLRELDQVLRQSSPCTGYPRNALVASAALVHAELIMAHPFREGNGRVGRWLADLMALQAGNPTLDWRFEFDTDRRRSEYFAAMAKSFAKDYSPLESLISSALPPF